MGFWNLANISSINCFQTGPTVLPPGINDCKDQQLRVACQSWVITCSINLNFNLRIELDKKMSSLNTAIDCKKTWHRLFCLYVTVYSCFFLFNAFSIFIILCNSRVHECSIDKNCPKCEQSLWSGLSCRRCGSADCNGRRGNCWCYSSVRYWCHLCGWRCACRWVTATTRSPSYASWSTWRRTSTWWSSWSCPAPYPSALSCAPPSSRAGNESFPITETFDFHSFQYMYVYITYKVTVLNADHLIKKTSWYMILDIFIYFYMLPLSTYLGECWFFIAEFYLEKPWWF